MWIHNATRIKEEHFDQMVHQAIEQVVTRLEMNETSMLGAQLDLNPSNYLPPQLQKENKYFSGKQAPSETNLLQYDGISVDFSISGEHMNTRLSTYHSDTLVFSIQERTPMVFNPRDKVDPFSQALTNIQKRLRNKLGEQGGQIMKDILISDKPIQERINRDMLDVSLLQAFEDRGIKLPFEFGVYDSRGILVTSTTSFKKDEASVVYQKQLFPNDEIGRVHV